MFKATLYLKTLKRIVTISTDVLYCTSRSNFSSVNPSVCSSSSLLGYAVSGEVFNNDKGVCRNFRNLNHDKCNFLRIQRRSFSLQSSFDSIVQTYARLFQLLSESTVVGHAQNTIITIHDMTGLPWWASIMLTTVLMRSLVTLPLSLYQNYVAAKLANVSVELKEIAKELSRETTIAAKQFYWSETQAKIMFRRSVRSEAKRTNSTK